MEEHIQFDEETQLRIIIVEKDGKVGSALHDLEHWQYYDFNKEKPTNEVLKKIAKVCIASMLKPTTEVLKRFDLIICEESYVDEMKDVDIDIVTMALSEQKAEVSAKQIRGAVIELMFAGEEMEEFEDEEESEDE